jgi:D-alanyl-D-alanine carboxypeptidase/D-alanyl-D-alanine-endopeptidase (penicillin-binding protein 4)
LALLGATAAQAQGFCDKVKALANDPAVAAAHWGVSVTALDGTVLCSLNEAQLFRPASNAKLFTMASALALLGPERRFTTTVVAEGDLTDGVLQGNLRLVGGGDANFGSTDVPYIEPSLRPKGPVQEPASIKDIEDLADQIVARGVKTVSGDVVGDDSYFAWDPYPVGWGVDDLTPGYGAPVSALTIHDSELEVDLTPAPKAGEEVGISFRPDVEYYGTDYSMLTSPAAPAPPGGQPVRGHLQLDRPVGTKQLRVVGELPLNAMPAKIDLAIQDPAEFAAKALRQALELRGVKIAGKTLTRHAALALAHAGPPSDPNAIRNFVAAPYPAWMYKQKASDQTCGPVADSAITAEPRETLLATHDSPRLADDVLYTSKESQNLHAEVLLRNLGTVWSCNRDAAAGGMGVLKAYVAQAGIAPADLVLYDGSGLSGHDLVAPRAFTQLLVYAAKQKWFDTFKGALPVGGVDGTLASRFAAPNSKLTGKVFAKTGTLGESRALSGYLTAASGTTIVFSVMVDNHPPGTTADRVAMDKMVEVIAAGN